MKREIKVFSRDDELPTTHYIQFELFGNKIHIDLDFDEKLELVGGGFPKKL